MNKALFAAAVSTLALVSTAAHADTTKFDAYVGAAVGFDSNQISDTEGSPRGGVTFDVRGSVAVPIKGTNLGVQGDVEYSNTEIANFGNWGYGNAHFGQETVALHGFTRTDKGLVGVIFQTTKQDAQDQYYFGNSDRRNYFGAEGQLYLNKVTLSGQATYFIAGGSPLVSDGYTYTLDSHGFDLAASAKYFVTPNTSLAAEAAFESAAYNYESVDTYTHNSWLAGFKAEHRLASTPVSYSLEATYREGKYLNDNTTRDHDLRVLVGVKFNFGSKTLLQRDRNGASLETVKSLAGLDNGNFGNYE